MVYAQRPARAARRAARQSASRIPGRPVRNLMARIRARRAGVVAPATSAPNTAANYQDILADYPSVNLADYPEYSY